MDLELTDAQREFQDRVGEFAAMRVDPAAAAIDEQGVFPESLIREAAALGLLGVTIPRDVGRRGTGLRQLRTRD